MTAIFIVLCFGVGIYCIAKFVIITSNNKKNSANDNKVTPRQARESLISKVSADFASAEWDDWDESIHRNDLQYIRIGRAVTSKDISLLHYSTKYGTALIRGERGHRYFTNGKGCSCRDFRERGLPCKHMYYLAMVLPDWKDSIQIDLEPLYDDMWFRIVGRGQNKAKNHIIENGGKIGKYLTDVAALIDCGNHETDDYIQSLANDYVIIPEEDLYSFWDDVYSVPSEQQTSEE